METSRLLPFTANTMACAQNDFAAKCAIRSKPNLRRKGNRTIRGVRADSAYQTALRHLYNGVGRHRFRDKVTWQVFLHQSRTRERGHPDHCSSPSTAGIASRRTAQPVVYTSLRTAPATRTPPSPLRCGSRSIFYHGYVHLDSVQLCRLTYARPTPRRSKHGSSPALPLSLPQGRR